jgi:hypothetical protein
VTNEYLASGKYEVVVANETKPAKLEMIAMYDPTNSRVKS